MIITVQNVILTWLFEGSHLYGYCHKRSLESCKDAETDICKDSFQCNTCIPWDIELFAREYERNHCLHCIFVWYQKQQTWKQWLCLEVVSHMWATENGMHEHAVMKKNLLLIKSDYSRLKTPLILS